MPSLLLGSLLALVSLVLAVLFAGPTNGYKDDRSTWPIEAQAVLAERPGQPLTQEQWKRINRSLNAVGAPDELRQGILSELARAWYIFLALPISAAALRMGIKRPPGLPHALALVAPSGLLLALVYAGSGL